MSNYQSIPTTLKGIEKANEKKRKQIEKKPSSDASPERILNGISDIMEEKTNKMIRAFGAVRESIYRNEDHTYFSLNLVNDTNQLVPAIYNTQLTQSLIDKPNDYHISVVSFNVSGNAIPLFNFLENYYGVTLSYKVGAIQYDFPVYLKLIISSTLYPNAVFNYQSFADMVNTALETSFNNMLSHPIVGPAILANESAPGITAEPYIIYDPVTFLFTLVATGDLYRYKGSPIDPLTPSYIQIWFNNSLAYLFSGFETFFNSFGTVTTILNVTTATNSKDTLLIIKDNFNFNYTGPATQIYEMLQTYASLYRWNNILRIVLTTNTLGAKTQVVQGNNNTGAPVYYPILASFIPKISSGVDAKGYIEYTPAFLTYIDLTSSTPLRCFDFQFGYITKQLNLEQIYLLPGESASLLLLFKHKTVLG